MTKTITIMTGSVRPNSVSDQLVPLVQLLLEKEGVTVQIASMKELQLPFVDSEIVPAADEFVPTHKSVIEWKKLVDESDGLVLLTPEYNHQMSAVQKNAIDWLNKEWSNKPVAVVSYGWGGGEKSFAMLGALLEKVGAKLMPDAAHLYFMKDISPSGEAIEAAIAREKISTAVKQLV